MGKLLDKEIQSNYSPSHYTQTHTHTQKISTLCLVLKVHTSTLLSGSLQFVTDERHFIKKIKTRDLNHIWLLQKFHSHTELWLFLALFITESLMKEVAGSWELDKMSISVEKKKTPRAWTAAKKAWHGKEAL